MGSGATLVDGVRRWFQRRSSATSWLANNSNNNNNNSNIINNNNKSNKGNKNNSHIVVHDNYYGHVSVSELRAESSTAHKRETKAGEEEEEELIVEEDFDVSGLKLIKVPLRFHVKASAMETQKKVLSDCLLCFPDLGLLGFQS